MQRFYRVVYRLDKSDDAGSLVERIAQAVSASGSVNHRISFAFTDAVLRGHKSALDYLVKCYTIFERYRTAMQGFPMRGAAMISDGQALQQDPNDEGVPVHTMVEVARGIPRRFAFGMAAFAWRGVPALDFTPDLAAPDNSVAGIYGRLAGRAGAPGITLVSSWGAPKRSLDLTAVVRMGDEMPSGKKPALPDVTRALLETIGRRKTDDVFTLPNPGEAAETKEALTAVDETFRRARAQLLQRVAQLPLEPLETAPSEDNPGSVKEPLAQALSPLGYAPARGAGSPGLIVFSKQTPEGHELRVSVDRGTWSHHFLARFEIRTEPYVRSMSVPLGPDDVPPRSYPQINQQQIHRLCSNLATVVREIEGSVYTAVRDALRSA